jgi:hypothetical protein
MSRALDGGSGGGGGGGNPPSPKPKAGPLGANPSLITATGGLFGTNNVLLVPFYDTRVNQSFFVLYDPTNFNCEDDCFYDFRLEDVQAAHNIDIHKVYFLYRDLGKVKFTVTVTATEFNRVTKKETTVSKSVQVTWGSGDNKLHSYFVDLKVVGERPQLHLFRKADAGPLAIVRAILIGHSDEGQIL